MYSDQIARQGQLPPLHPQKVLAKYPPLNLRGLRRHHPELIAKFGPYCQGCSIDLLERPELLEIDHIRPTDDGGTSDFHNLALLCSSCNREKGFRFTLTGLQERLLRRGVRIRENLIREGRIGRANKTEEWRVPGFPEIVVHFRPLEQSAADFAAFVVKQKTDERISLYQDFYQAFPRTIDHQIYLKYERMDPTVTLPFACVRIENTVERISRDWLSPKDVMDAPAKLVAVVHREIVDRYEKDRAK